MSFDTLNTLTPKPAHITAQPGSFVFTSPVGVWADAGAGDVAALVQAELGRATGLAFQPADAATAQLVLRLTGDDASSERYTLSVSARGV